MNTTGRVTLSERQSDAAGVVRERLLAVEWTVDGLHSLLGDDVGRALARDSRIAVRRALRPFAADPRAALTRLFLLGDALQSAELEPIADLLDPARDLGLVADANDGLRAMVDLRPYGHVDGDGDEAHNWFVVSDRTDTGRAELAGDHVLGIGGASLTLAALVPRDRAETALDLGTGCGIQSLHLTTHCQRVVATDVSERAAHLASLTFALSGVDVDVRVGDFFAPVAGEMFDLVVSNPPFVISPAPTHTYRDGGMPADSLAQRLAGEVVDFLRPAGTAVLLANWLHVRGTDWRDRVAAWVADLGCDTWVAQREVSDPHSYVDLWLDDAASGTHDLNRVESWLDYFAALEVEAIGFGWIALRRSADPVPARFEDVTDADRLPDGRDTRHTLDRLPLSAAEVVGGAWRIHTESRVRTTNALTVGEPEGAGLSEVWADWRGIFPVSARMLEVLRRCDGTAALLDLVEDDELAEALVTFRELAIRGVVLA